MKKCGGNSKFKNMKFQYIILAALLTSTATLSSCFKEDINEALGTINPEISIYSLRNFYKSNTVNLDKGTLEGAKYTAGVVISDREGNNLPKNVIAIQSDWRGNTRGLLVKLNNADQYAFGDSIQIDLENSKLIKDQNRLILEVSQGSPKVLASGISKSYRSVAINTLKDRFTEFESTLVNITADIEPEPSSSTIFAGTKQIIDGEGNKLNIVTEANASFANEKIAPSATFQGIALASTNGPELRLQKSADMMYPSGRLYQGWPETFEQPDTLKAGYAILPVQLSTGTWLFDQSMLGTTLGRDRIVSGNNAVRFQQNLNRSSYLQMEFDVPNGASKITLWYGAYYTDRSSTFQLGYTIDQGETWKLVDAPITDAHSTSVSLVAKQAVFLVDIKQPVRFRINKLGLGTSLNSVSNGRLGIDDIAIYQGY